MCSHCNSLPIQDPRFIDASLAYCGQNTTCTNRSKNYFQIPCQLYLSILFPSCLPYFSITLFMSPLTAISKHHSINTSPTYFVKLYSIGSFSCPCNPGFTGFQGGVGFHVIIISMVRGGEVIHTFGILIKGVLYMWQTLERDFWGPKFAINPCQADNTNRQHHHQRLFLLRFAATQSRIGCICFFFKCAFSRFFKCVLSRWAATTWTSVPTTQTPANTADPTMRAVST